MKALSVMQPWASLLVNGTKKIELRTWSTPYRGPLAICAGVRVDPRGARHPSDGPRGVLLGEVVVTAVRPATMADANAAGVTSDQMTEALRVAKAKGKTLFAWVVDRPRATAEHRPVRGLLGIFNLDPRPSQPEQCTLGGICGVSER